jgi:hypothetical protein
MVVKRSTKSKVFIMSLNSLLLAVFILSTWCYYIVYTGEDPMELLFIFFISCPILLVLGIILLFYGKRFEVPIFNRLISFIGVAVLIAPILGSAFPISGFPSVPALFGYDYRTLGLVGTYIGISLGILTVATTVAIVVSKQSRSRTSHLK